MKENWSAYNDAQTNEKLLFLDVLSELCSYVPLEEAKGRGRPSTALSEMVFACVIKEYECLSSRRNTSDLEIARRRGYIGRTPHFNTVLNYFNKPELTPVLVNLIHLSALPLKDFELTFAVDATGLSNAFYSRWLDSRLDKQDKYHDWIKVHLICGVKSNIVTHITITDGHKSDTTQFPELVNETMKLFDVREVCADKGYLSEANFDLVWKTGATPYIPFKKNNRRTARHGEAWTKMLLWFYSHQDEFMKRYHQRSNVESTFSMLKRKLGSKLMLKNEIGKTNEALARVLCHNICVLIKESYGLGIELDFRELAQKIPQLHIKAETGYI
ncbi:MAG: transposase [archaeon]